MFAFGRVTQDIDKGFHFGILFDVSKDLKQEEADGIIGKSGGTVPVCNDRSDKKKSIREDINLAMPPTIRPSGSILIYRRW